MASKTPPKKKKKNPGPAQQVPSEKIYRIIFEQAVLPTIIISKDSTISLANRKFFALSGYSRRDIEGKKTWMEFVAPDAVNALTAYLSESIQKKGTIPKPYPFLFVDKKKNTRDMFLTVGFIPNSRHIILSLANRIDEQQKSQDLCNTQQMSGVIYNIPEATFATDQQGNVIAWNRAIEELTGGLGTDILGKGDHEYSVPFFQDRRPMIIDLIFARLYRNTMDRQYPGCRNKGDAFRRAIKSDPGNCLACFQRIRKTRRCNRIDHRCYRTATTGTRSPAFRVKI
jgi:PAS domain S-box-containing protein